jgi:hypothetical protein
MPAKSRTCKRGSCRLLVRHVESHYTNVVLQSRRGNTWLIIRPNRAPIVLEQSNHFGNGHGRALLSQMRNRSAYRTMLFRNREIFRSRVLNSNLIDLMVHEELQGAVRDVMLFLTSANSLRALIFAASF